MVVFSLVSCTTSLYQEARDSFKSQPTKFPKGVYQQWARVGHSFGAPKSKIGHESWPVEKLCVNKLKEQGDEDISLSEAKTQFAECMFQQGWELHSFNFQQIKIVK